MRGGYWLFSVYDAAVLSLAAPLALFVRQDFNFASSNFSTLYYYMGIIFAISFVSFLVVRSHRPLWRYASLANLATIVMHVTLIIAFALVISFLMFRLEAIPRSVPFIQALLGIGAMGAPRLLIRLMGREHRSTVVAPEPTNLREHVLIVGLSSVTDLYLRCVDELGKGRFEIEGILTEEGNAQGRALRDVPVLGAPAELPLVLNDLHVHGVEISRIVLTVPFDSLSEAAQKELHHWENHGLISLDMFEERLGFRDVPELGQGVIGAPPPDARSTARPGTMPTKSKSATEAAFEAPPTQFPKGFFALKRAYDIASALVLMILLLPLYALGAFFVLFDLGVPIVFWQVRPGLHHIPIRVHKLRTMGPGHDRRGNPIPDEHRISLIGRFLRRCRLDELPQLYDVLVGNLSLVGPRPLLPKDMPHNVAWRYQVRPGITGWAQVNGGHLLRPDQKLLLDRYYIENASVWFDVKILLLTLIAAFCGDKINLKVIAKAEEAFSIHHNREHPPLSSARGVGE